jgi:signal transduction histidine kinase
MSTILLVDDNPADRALFRRILGGGGHAVHELVRGSEVPAVVREIRPHVIVLDVNLPDIDGHEVCRMLRADPLASGIPVLMLTVRDRLEDVIAGLDAGADDYVAKDEAVEVILARVNRLANYRKLATIAVLNEQLAQVGRLLAGIVHEIRSPLSVIRGHAELMQMLIVDNPQVQEYVEPILRNAILLQSRLDHLMAAVRTGPASPKLLSIGPVVREASDLFLKGIDPRRKRVKIEVEVAEGLPLVVADPGRIIQVVLNLVANAHDAILAHRELGEIVVRVQAHRLDEAEWVEIVVIDDGPGIPAHLLPRIFEPFFTTKAEGTGYGLYLAGEIIREQGGRLEACNRPEGGACFSILIPVASEEALLAGEE